MNRLTRREYLALVLAASAQAERRQLGSSPVISVQDFEQYPSVITPSEDFFIRNHFETPAIDAGAWTLGIGAREFSLKALRALPQRRVTALLECAGNGVGVGAVGCVNWGGIPLGELLRSNGIAAEMKYVRLTGIDRGHEPDGPTVPYSRCLSLNEAMRSETLLTLSMNGAPLPPDHGFPARVIVPGRYGMDSVKWLENVELIAAPDDSFYMTQRFRRVHNANVGEPVGVIRVKSTIVKPVRNAAVRGQTLEVCGYAWAGAAAIEKVEVQLNEGAWKTARILTAAEPFTWVAWSYEARLETPGAYTVASRATSRTGEAQPEVRDPSRDDQYELNQVQRLRFFYRP